MGRIQVVLSDEIESKFRKKLAKEGKIKKGSISEEIEKMVEMKLSQIPDSEFLKQDDADDWK